MDYKILNLLAISLLPNSPRIKFLLYKEILNCFSSIDDFLEASQSDIESLYNKKVLVNNLPNVSSFGRDLNRVKNKIVLNKYLWDQGKKEYEICTREKIQLIPIFSRNFPELLKNIIDPPLLLYLKGATKCFLPSGTAVVGARLPTLYGINVTKRLVQESYGYDHVIVSGGAMGIDSEAHFSAIEYDVPTICVLGGGLGYLSPQSNIPLFEQITNSDTNALITEFPFNICPNKYSFPQRNRIIAGLSKKVIIVEAGIRSGSLITANLAVDYDRDVFAVPGPIDSPMSMGTNNLVFNGANPLIDIKFFYENNIKKRLKNNLILDEKLDAMQNN